MVSVFTELSGIPARISLPGLVGIGLASGGSRLADTDKVITGRAHSNCSFLLSEHLHNYIMAGRRIAPDTDLAICRTGVGSSSLCIAIYVHTYHLAWECLMGVLWVRLCSAGEELAVVETLESPRDNCAFTCKEMYVPCVVEVWICACGWVWSLWDEIIMALCLPFCSVDASNTYSSCLPFRLLRTLVCSLYWKWNEIIVFTFSVIFTSASDICILGQFTFVLGTSLPLSSMWYMVWYIKHGRSTKWTCEPSVNDDLVSRGIVLSYIMVGCDLFLAHGVKMSHETIQIINKWG